MTALPTPLPDDPEALKQLVAQQAATITFLREQLNLHLAKRFGPSSEQVAPDQLGLFNEAEANDAGQDDPDAPEVPEATTPVAGHRRHTPGRKPLPDHLPRVRVEHDLPAAARQCPCGCGAMRCIGEETSEQLDLVPAQVRVVQHVRFKYACPVCADGVTIAPLPPQPIPKSNAAPGLLAAIATHKYADALPLYRQQAILARAGIALPRATLASWMIRAGRLIRPLIDALRSELLAYDLIQMDETPVQVLKEDGRPATSTSYMWVQRGGPPERPVILFDYDRSRGQQVPLRLLDGFAGYLQSDGYDGYAAITRRADVTGVGCWAHARRKFDEAIKSQGKNPKTGKAHQGLAYLQKLYRIEREGAELAPAERLQHRREQAAPILEQLKVWLERSIEQVPPKGATGRALGYLRSQWPRLIRYLDDGRIPIDNNAAERAIRPFVTGRKNWLFSDTIKGAEASANLYSLIETAKANGLEPFAYLRRVFEQLPAANGDDAIAELLPWAVATGSETRQDGVG